MKTVYDYFASEIMDVIEREHRINKDDLVLAAEIGMRKHGAAMEQAVKDERKAVQCALASLGCVGRNIDDKATPAKETEPLVKAWWDSKEIVKGQWVGTVTAGGGGASTSYAHTVVVGVDPAKTADASYYTLTTANVPAWMKA